VTEKEIDSNFDMFTNTEEKNNTKMDCILFNVEYVGFSVELGFNVFRFQF